jgi:hypothetical protein
VQLRRHIEIEELVGGTRHTHRRLILIRPC